MTPYRTAEHRPLRPDVDVKRFVTLVRGRRRARQLLSLTLPAFLLAALYLPLATQHLRTTGEGSSLVSTSVPFGSTPRRLPTVHVAMIGAWTCVPHEPNAPMSDGEQSAERDRELLGIDCANWWW